MPDIRCSSLLAALCALVLLPAEAVESGLGAALAIPSAAMPTETSDFQPDAFFTANLTRLLEGRFSKKSDFSAEGLSGSLASLGLESRRFSAPRPVPSAGTPEKGTAAVSVRPVLTQSVCFRTHEKTDAKALLITLPAEPQWARRTALLWDWARSAKNAVPLWLCMTAADAPDAGFRAVDEILRKAREQRPDTGFKDFPGFSGHLALQGGLTQGFVNFAGMTSVTVAVTDRYIQWRDTHREKNNAYAAAVAVEKAWTALPTTFQVNRSAPYVGVAFSPIVCRKDWASLLTSACTFRAAFASRAKASLTETAEAAYEAAQTTVHQLNGESRTGARRDLSVSFPENYSWPPAVQTTSDLRSAWENAFAAQPGAVLSSRFAASPAAVSAQTGITAFTLGASDDSAPDTPAEENALITMIEKLTR